MKDELPLQFRLRIASGVSAALDGQFRHLELSSFANQLSEIESVTLTLVTQYVLMFLNENYSTYLSSGELSFSIRGGEYELIVAPRVGESLVDILLLGTQDKDIKPLEQEVEIHGWGMVNRAYVRVPQKFRTHFRPLCEIVQVAFESSYVWMEGEVKRRLVALDHGCSAALYGRLRPALAAAGARNFGSFVWFGLFTRETGHYLVDLDSASNAMSLLSARTYRSHASPASHLLGLFGTSVPYPKSVARLVFERDSPIDFPIQRAAYASDAPIYIKTEEQIFPGGRVTLVPVATFRKARLTCGFPTIHRPLLLNTIMSLRQDLGNVFNEEMRHALRYLEAVKRHLYGVDWADAGSFVGSAFVAAFKEALR